MEVKIGVQNSSRELVLELTKSSDDVVKAVTNAIAKGTTVDLTDAKGRRVLVPVATLAYVDIGEPEERRVGFGPM